MFFITFLALPYSKIRFIVSELDGKCLDFFPNTMIGTFELSMGWKLSFSSQELKLFNPEKGLVIKESLTEKLKLHKYTGFYVLERSDEEHAQIILLKPINNKLEIYLPQQGYVPVFNKECIIKSTELDGAVIHINKNSLGSLISNKFFNIKIFLEHAQINLFAPQKPPSASLYL